MYNIISCLLNWLIIFVCFCLLAALRNCHSAWKTLPSENSKESSNRILKKNSIRKILPRGIYTSGAVYWLRLVGRMCTAHKYIRLFSDFDDFEKSSAICKSRIGPYIPEIYDWTQRKDDFFHNFYLKIFDGNKWYIQ